MDKYRIEITTDDVGNIARAFDEHGELIDSAKGFGVKDAKRRLKARLQGTTSPRTVMTRTSRSRKVHSAPGVIFAAKRNIERYREKRADKSKK